MNAGRNYYTLINRMFRIRLQFNLSISEQLLYRELVDLWHELGMAEQFSLSNAQIYNRMNCTDKTLIKARETLINCGLICYTQGQSSKQRGLYSFGEPVTKKKGKVIYKAGDDASSLIKQILNK